MGADFHSIFLLDGETATNEFAATLAPHLVAGDTLLLSGQIGAGKTHFARALIQARLAAADRMEDVPSPTFTLVQTYNDGLLEIWHADLYRLSHVDEVLELGLDAAFADAITLIEWPDRLSGNHPSDALKLEFTVIDDTSRRIDVSSVDRRWAGYFDTAPARANA